MYGNDYEYAGTRLTGTIVREASTNEPLRVEYIAANGMCDVVFLDPKKGAKTLHIDKLNLKPVNLGYCNYSGQAQYISRIPMRRDYKQGLRAQTIFIPTGVNFNNIPMAALRLTIMGKFPTYERAIQETTKRGNVFKNKCLAFHRHWAINNGTELLYKNGVKVGKYEKDSFLLEERWWHLKEYLERCML